MLGDDDDDDDDCDEVTFNLSLTSKIDDVVDLCLSTECTFMLILLSSVLSLQECTD